MAIAMGMLRNSAAGAGETSTRRISSVAYADELIASELKMASAFFLFSRSPISSWIDRRPAEHHVADALEARDRWRCGGRTRTRARRACPGPSSGSTGRAAARRGRADRPACGRAATASSSPAGSDALGSAHRLDHRPYCSVARGAAASLRCAISFWTSLDRILDAAPLERPLVRVEQHRAGARITVARLADAAGIDDRALAAELEVSRRRRPGWPPSGRPCSR